MKIVNWILCLGMLSSLHASVRNPFIMPLSLCEETLMQLDGWRLQGVITASSRNIALMAHAKYPPLRVSQGSLLMAGASVVTVNRYRVSVSLNDLCDGAHYHWHLTGGKNDKDINRRIAVAAAHRQGQSARDSDSR